MNWSVLGNIGHPIMGGKPCWLLDGLCFAPGGVNTRITATSGGYTTITTALVCGRYKLQASSVD
ncbi:MAG: hypothetical protein ABSD85_10765 [Acidimicrobiales bacterium]|jgi:hypothetical protein